MRFLLDTHIFLLWMAGNSQLSLSAQRVLYKSDNEIFVSSVSIAEIAIKVRLGKLKLKVTLEQLVNKVFSVGVALELPFTNAHVLRLSTLPLHHRDPFDRMLISQAISDSMTLVTADHDIHMYEVATLE